MAATALVLAAHPDDAEICMGATVAKLVRQGWRVELCDLTDGEPTPAGSPERRAAEAARAAAILGVARRTTLALPNRYLMDGVQARQQAAEVIREVRPDLLFLHYWEDAHPDHVQASRLGEAARFYAKLTKTEMRGEPCYPRRVVHFVGSHYRLHRAPSFILDVSDSFETKLEAVAAYESQFGAERGQEWVAARSRPPLAPALRSLGEYFGRLIGVRYGEPFIMREEVGLASLDALL
ncbi:MAG: bacillithiol biosynthesis deacetylase BshB1 [Deltaproteobacteria bacterium]|nr:bacillithiol biosynthesis deacetylase BshB1 [Deltaproteobacteria bacterium]